MDMAASVLEKPEKQACFSISQGSVACSVCLEVVTDAGERSIAKLKCGHHFHLDCIGSAFNAKGAMQCPNCRHVEDGQWLYANGCRPCDDFTIDDISYEDDYEVYPGMPELVSAYDEFQANHVQWCPYQHFGGSYPQLSFSLEDFEGPPGVGSALGYTDLIVNVLYGEHPTSSGHACPYLATQGTMVPGRLVRQGEDIHNLPPVTHGHADMSLPAANGGTGMTDPGPGSQSFLAPDRGRSWTRRAVGLSGPSGHDDTQPGLLGLSPLERVRSWSRPEAERPPLPGPVGHVSGNHSGAAIQFGYGVRPVEGGSSSVLHENAPCPRNYYMHGPGGGSQLPQIASPPIRHGVISNQSRRPRHRNAIATPLMSVGGRGIQPAPPPEQARRYAGVWGGGSGTQGQDPNLMVEGSGWHGNSQGFGWRREASQMGVAPSASLGLPLLPMMRMPSGEEQCGLNMGSIHKVQLVICLPAVFITREIFIEEMDLCKGPPDCQLTSSMALPLFWDTSVLMQGFPSNRMRLSTWHTYHTHTFVHKGRLSVCISTDDGAFSLLVGFRAKGTVRAQFSICNNACGIFASLPGLKYAW